MNDQLSFDFCPERDANPTVGLSIAEINRKFRAMQAMPDGPEKDAAAQEILNWILQQ